MIDDDSDISDDEECEGHDKQLEWIDPEVIEKAKAESKRRKEEDWARDMELLKKVGSQTFNLPGDDNWLGFVGDLMNGPYATSQELRDSEELDRKWQEMQNLKEINSKADK